MVQKTSVTLVELHTLVFWFLRLSLHDLAEECDWLRAFLCTENTFIHVGIPVSRALFKHKYTGGNQHI